MKQWNHLSYASSLCGNCTAVCPVKINLHEILLENRSEAVREGDAGWMERAAWRGWKQASLHRKWMNMGNHKLKNWVINRMFKGWTGERADLVFPPKTFNERWKESRKG
jgi:L-lactate dehydrogenase complex protein LldF